MQHGVLFKPFQRKQTVLPWFLRLSLFGMMFTLAAGTMGCERSGKRVKMSKPPNPLVTQRNPKVKGEQLAGNRKAMIRSAQLKASDAASILGGFTYKARSTYIYKKGSRTLRLTRIYTLQQRANGDFRAHLENNRDKGFEVRWINHALYQRDRYRPFRIVSREIAIAHRWQRRGYGQWRSIVGLFGTRLALAQAGQKQIHGRTALQYRMALHGDVQKIQLPKEGTAWDGPVPNSTRGAAAKHKRRLLTASGNVWIDQDSGLALQVAFTGRYSIGEGKDAATATLRIQASFSSLGDPTVDVPQKSVLIGREPDPKDPFAGNKAPSYMQPPPRDTPKKRRRRR